MPGRGGTRIWRKKHTRFVAETEAVCCTTPRSRGSGASYRLRRAGPPRRRPRDPRVRLELLSTARGRSSRVSGRGGRHSGSRRRLRAHGPVRPRRPGTPSRFVSSGLAVHRCISGGRSPTGEVGPGGLRYRCTRFSTRRPRVTPRRSTNSALRDATARWSTPGCAVTNTTASASPTASSNATLSSPKDGSEGT